MSENNTTAHASGKNLLQRLKKEMLDCHYQMEVLKILFKNLENSWLAINLDYRIVKEEVEEKSADF